MDLDSHAFFLSLLKDNGSTIAFSRLGRTLEYVSFDQLVLASLA